MGTAIVLLILVVVVIFSIRGYLKKTRYGCCGSGGGEQKVKQHEVSELCDPGGKRVS